MSTSQSSGRQAPSRNLRGLSVVLASQQGRKSKEKEIIRTPPGLPYIINSDSMSPPPAAQGFEDLEPRVPVTASMLCAYSHMRGHLGEDASDPLYSSLYPAASRDFKHTVRLPVINDRESIEALQRAAKFFWGPLTAPTGITTQAPPATESTSTNPTEQDLDLIQRQGHEPGPSTSTHYNDGQVLANFGYVQIDGKWVDPESEGELYNAYMQRSGDDGDDLDIAELHRSRDPGPHILSEQEQVDFYKQFTLEVANSIDGEGNPRDLRITPETFARWAEGASKVDGYAESVVDPLKLLSLPIKKDPKVKNPKPPRQQQFDQETGSRMSDNGEQSSDPSLIKLPRGVNLHLVNLPEQFSKSYPRELRSMNRKAFRKEKYDRSEEWVASSVDAGLLEFSTKEAGRALAEGGDIEDGIKRFREASHKILDLYEANSEEEEKLAAKHATLSLIIKKRTDLQREIYKLQSSSIKAQGWVSPLTGSPRTRIRKLYERQLAERLEDEQVKRDNNKLADEKLDGETQDALKEVDELRGLREQLLAEQAKIGRTD